MKKFMFIVLLLPGLRLQAQSPNNIRGEFFTHYILESFSAGKVYLKSGEITDRKLNYNTLTGEMIFENNGGYLAIANAEQVDSVLITTTAKTRRFIPVGKQFYEYITGVTIPLYAQYTGKINEAPVQTGYGTTSQSSPSNTLRTLIGNGSVYGLKLPDEFKVTTKTAFLVWKDKEYHKVTGTRDLTKLFPEKKEQIKAWESTHKTNYSDQEELAQLIQQLQ